MSLAYRLIRPALFAIDPERVHGLTLQILRAGLAGGTARTIVLAMRLGHSLEQAIALAIEELRELKSGFLAGVVIHALDAKGNHKVVSLNCEEQIKYWFWDSNLPEPEHRFAEPFTS